MKLTSKLLYFIIKLNDIREFLLGLSIWLLTFGIIGSIISIIYKCCYFTKCISYTLPPFITNISILFVIFGILSIFLSYFLPSTKEMAAIIVTPMIVNNKEIYNIPKKLIKLAEDWVDKITKKQTTQSTITIPPPKNI